MHNLLLFALRRRFAAYVSNAGSVLSLFLRLLYVGLLLVNAAMLGWLTDVLAASDDPFMATDDLIRLISAGLCGLWTLLEFFPTYAQRSRLIARVFPVCFAERWRTNLIYDSITATTVGTIVAFGLIDALSNAYTHLHLANSLLLFSNTIAFVQLIKAFVEDQHRHRLLLIIVWVALTSAVVLLPIYQLPGSGWLAGGLGLCLLSQFALLAYADRSATRTTNSPWFAGNLSWFKRVSPVSVAFWNNPKARSAFGLGLLLKAGFLAFMGHPFLKASPMPMGEFLGMVYVSPLILFTYVANNLWGFFPALWVNSTLGKRTDMYRIYVQLLSLPLLLDLIITLGVCLYLGMVDATLLTFYGLSTVALSVNGLIFSLYKAFYVKSSLNFSQMKNNVNNWSMLTAALLIGLTILATKTAWTTLLFGAGLIAGTWYLLTRTLPNDTDNTHTLYEQLFIHND